MRGLIGMGLADAGPLRQAAAYIVAGSNNERKTFSARHLSFDVAFAGAVKR